MLCHVAELTDVSEKRNPSISGVKKFNSANKLLTNTLRSVSPVIRNATAYVVKSFEFS